MKKQTKPQKSDYKQKNINSKINQSDQYQMANKKKKKLTN